MHVQSRCMLGIVSVGFNFVSVGLRLVCTVRSCFNPSWWPHLVVYNLFVCCLLLNWVHLYPRELLNIFLFVKNDLVELFDWYLVPSFSCIVCELILTSNLICLSRFAIISMYLVVLSCRTLGGHEFGVKIVSRLGWVSATNIYCITSVWKNIKHLKVGKWVLLSAKTSPQ